MTSAAPPLPTAHLPPSPAPPVFLVAGDTARNPGRSGIQTVVRSLAGAFAERRAPVRPVVWNVRRAVLRPLPPELELGPGAEPLRDPAGRLPWSTLRYPRSWYHWLRGGGRHRFLPLHLHPLHRHAPPGAWVLLAELMYTAPGGAPKLRQLLDYVRRRRWRLAAIFHDSIPVDRPDLVPPELPARHAAYMRDLTRADLILPTSASTAAGWHGFLARENLGGPPVRVCTLACDFVGTPRVRAAPSLEPPGEPVRLLCVSTLEPRKNHAALLAAYEIAVRRRPGLRLELDLVGAPYVGSQDLVHQVTAATARLPGLRWRRQVEYAELRSLYAACDFTVYPSVLEGFGLPVIESLWLGRPCVCADFGVMAENAAGGGCLTVDVRDPALLADAILALADSPALRRRLAEQAVARPLKTWGEYADEILTVLATPG